MIVMTTLSAKKLVAVICLTIGLFVWIPRADAFPTVTRGEDPREILISGNPPADCLASIRAGLFCELYFDGGDRGGSHLAFTLYGWASTSIILGSYCTAYGVTLTYIRLNNQIPVPWQHDLGVIITGPRSGETCSNEPETPTPPETQNTHTLPYVLPASNGAQTGFVRIVNQSDQAGTVSITAIDDTGERFGPINLSLDANEAVNFNSRDLESGNARKGLSRGAGDGSGSWRLILETALSITPLAYIRTSDGFVTAMHDIAAATEAGTRRYQILFFNPGSNTRQVSRLRLINTSEMAASVEITALDDPGMAAPGGTVNLEIPAGGARTLTAQALESGGQNFSGRLGDGTGKWRLTVSSNVDIQVMNLLATPTGHLANLSTAPGVAE